MTLVSRQHVEDVRSDKLIKTVRRLGRKKTMKKDS